MRRFLWSQFRYRRGRSAALGLAILVAAASFTLLTASASTSSLHVHGTLKSSFRPAYDVLVRPADSPTPLERSEGLVRPNFLSGVYHGITLAQWHEIERIPGVAVAAPSENLGYALFPVGVSFSIARLVDKAPNQLYRFTYSYVTNDGRSHYTSAFSAYIYYHPYALSPKTLAFKPPQYGPLPEYPYLCLGFNNSASPFPGFPPTPFKSYPGMFCSPAPGTETTFQSGGVVPVKLGAIDPVAEAKLLRLDHAVVAGRYLREGERTATAIEGGLQGSNQIHVVPVIVSNHVFYGEHPQVRVQRLSIPSGIDFDRIMASGACVLEAFPCKGTIPPAKGSRWKTAAAFVESLPRKTIVTKTFSITASYQLLLEFGDTGYRLVHLDSYWQDSPVRYHSLGPDHLEPRTVTNPYSIWTQDHGAYQGLGYFNAPPENQDVQFRRLLQVYRSPYIHEGVIQAPQLHIVGRYDPYRLPGFSPLSRVPLETYYPPELEPGDAAANRVLKGQPLLPTQNLGDYIAAPPLLLTTLTAARTLLAKPGYENPPLAERRAPIAAIRIKVAGVTGPDPLSLERIKVVAQRIYAETGLTVDITAGSSPHPVLVTLPKGKFGRPQLLLREGWSKKGVTVSFLRALDRKDVALFALVLVVCAFFLGNGALASVRSRRGEIGALLTLGWSPGEVFRAVLGELLLVGLLAGIAGAGLAAGLVAAFSLHLPLVRTLLVVPIAVVLALVAGVLPAWRAARGRPLDAIRPPVTGGGGGRRVRGIAGMALVNLARLPGRMLVGAAGLMLGVAALTILVGIERGFQGTLVGTVLGSAISLQVRGADFVALGLTLALAALSAGDVLYLNLRERQAEIVTLTTLGWSDTETRLLVALEAFLLAVGASLAGATVGVLVGALVLGVGVVSLLFAAALAAAAAALAAFAASLLPLLRLRGLSAPEILAAE